MTSAQPSPPRDVMPDCRPFAGDARKPKSIFVFLDGTQNDSTSRTNVRRLYEAVCRNNDPQAVALYLEGVGSVREPVLGPLLGHGMEDRILKAYLFIAEEHRDADRVYLFGFSRGAHEARALAGFLAYFGVPLFPCGFDESQRRRLSDDLLDLLKTKDDAAYVTAWKVWTPVQGPPLGPEVRGKFGVDMRTVEVTLLGLWDTVPGSSFKKYGVRKDGDGKVGKERIGFWKRYLSWLPMISPGERYKTDSYPPIRRIVHAVALDEKRSKFAPLLLCPAIVDEATTVIEVWFPGAHADVGGGYDDAGEDGLPNISLNWMRDQLVAVYPFDISRVPECATGLAHWSIGDFAGHGSKCQDRRPGANIHPSHYERMAAPYVPIRIHGSIRQMPYPVTCQEAARGGW
jgi:hypothetical protein